MRIKNTLQTKMVVLLVVFAFFSAAIVGGVSVYLSINSTEKKTIDSNSIIANQISSEIGRFMDDARGLTESIALSPTSYSMDAGKIREMIITTQQKNPQFELIYVMDANGMQIARTSGNLANRADRAYFKGAIGGNTFFTDNYISSFTNAPTVTISTPIKDSSGKILGVFAADISLKAVWEIAERTAIGASGYIDVVDNKGTLIAHPNKEKVLKGENVASNTYIQNVMGGQGGSVTALSTQGQKSLITFAPIKSYNWGVVTYLSNDEINESATRIVLIMGVLIIIAAVLAAISALYMARAVVKPLTLLAESAEKMAGGDLSQQINVQGVEEVNQLAASLGKMQEGLKKTIRSILVSSEKLADSAEQLTAGAEQSAQAANQVASSISDVAHGTDRQLNAVSETASVVQQLSASIQQVNASTKQVEGNSVKAAQSAREGGKSVEKAVSQMARIEQTVNNSAHVVTELGERSKEIGQIVDTISGIAGQTNLLALNAAIEAARAGEQGRGFAVVAEEVRKLAEQSQSAAKQIAALISEIQGNTDKAVIAMSEGTREVKVGTDVVAAAGHAFSEIAELVTEVSSQVKGTLVAISEMTVGSQKIVTAMNEIDELSRHAAGETQTVSAATEEQSASVEEISSASQSLAKMAQDLQDTVSTFRV